MPIEIGGPNSLKSTRKAPFELTTARVIFWNTVPFFNCNGGEESYDPKKSFAFETWESCISTFLVRSQTFDVNILDDLDADNNFCNLHFSPVHQL